MIAELILEKKLQVNDLGNPKNKGKVKEVPAHADICEPCRNYLENGEDIPLTLLAKLIKFKLLDIKAKDVRRRDSEKKVYQNYSSLFFLYIMYVMSTTSISNKENSSSKL